MLVVKALNVKVPKPILGLLKMQNEGLKTEDWHIVIYFTAVIGVRIDGPEESFLKKLRMFRMKACVELWKATIPPLETEKSLLVAVSMLKNYLSVGRNVE